MKIYILFRRWRDAPGEDVWGVYKHAEACINTRNLLNAGRPSDVVEFFYRESTLNEAIE